jgi:ribosomal protein S18 acetylase RimI-like enzyme
MGSLQNPYQRQTERRNMLKLSVGYNYGNATDYTFIETETDEHIGRCSMFKYPDRYELWNFRIFPGFKRQGYGTKMLLEVIKRYKRFIKDKPLILYVYKTNNIAIHLYESLGFNITKDAEDNVYEMQFCL